MSIVNKIKTQITGLPDYQGATSTGSFPLNKLGVRMIFLFLVFAELLSFFAWLLPDFNLVCFFVILAVTLVLSLKKLEYGIYILLAELFIGSKGYLFSFELGDILVSIRMGLFLVVMAVWILSSLKSLNTLKSLKDLKKFIPLGVVILWGLVWGLLRGNNFGDVFFDFNNWLYFLLIFPFYYVVETSRRLVSTDKKDGFLKSILSVMTAAVLWLGIKSLILLYIFSHEFAWALPEVYKWIRDTGVGEVTPAGAGFYRVFLQSQLYALLLFFIILPISNFKFLISKQIPNSKFQILNLMLLVLCLTTVILSFSRSFWVGLAAGLIFYLLILILNKTKFIDIFKKSAKVLMIGIVAFGVVFLVINLPPQPTGIDLASLLGKRVGEMEAASSSRVNQIKPLFQAIGKHPVIGSGFGTSVTYQTGDPRIVPTTAGSSGEFTTYAFEWGYLDMLLKFGAFGLFVYLYLIFSILKRLLNPKSKTLNPKQMKASLSSRNSAGWLQSSQNSKSQDLNNYGLRITDYGLRYGFALAVIALLAVNVFSPYLNHPLGIGFIIISSIFCQKENPHLE